MTDIVTRSQPWDVVVVGSGASGSVAAMGLAQKGLNVLVLEAGPEVDSRRELGPGKRFLLKSLFRHFVTRRQSIQEQHPGYWEGNPDLFVDDIQHPYTAPSDKPFRWIRGRQVGGRTLTWGGTCLRFSDFELKAADNDGSGPSWPLEYREIAPYYDRVESVFAVHGSKENLPQLPDGKFLAPKDMTNLELLLKNRVSQLWPDRQVIIGRGIDRGTKMVDQESWPSRSVQAIAPFAGLKKRKITVQPNSIVSQILCDSDNGRVRAVEYIDRVSKTVREIPAKVVALCASTIETLRILLRSSSARHPGGIGNSRGLLGKFVMDHISVARSFYIPDFKTSISETVASACDCICIPRFQNLEKPNRDYIRGFGIIGALDRVHIPRLLRNPEIGNSATGLFFTTGEALPREKNQVTLNPHLKDSWGLSAAHIEVSWGENDLKMAEDMNSTLEELIDLAGGRRIDLHRAIKNPLRKGFLKDLEKQSSNITIPGLFVHEAGGARMGDDPKNSVLNRFGQCWDSNNLFVLDCASWPSSGWQNPTLTEMALALRGADRIASELKKGNL